MSRDNHSIDSLASFLSLCQTTVNKDEEETKTALASRARQMVKVLKLDLRATSQLVLDGRHPLVEACRTGNIKIVQMFVTQGATLNFVDPDGRSPLYAAIVGRNCSPADIRQLLRWGADVNLHRDGKLPLFASLYCMGTEVSRLLISEGADVNNVVLTCFCFIESVFALNTTLVMVMSGFQMRQFEDLPAMVTLALEIVLAGLLPKTFYLSSGKRHPTRTASGNRQRYQLEEETLMATELALLWKLQHLCLCLGFRVDRMCVETAITEVREQLHIDTSPVPSDETLITLADQSVAGASNFLRKSQPFSSCEGGRGPDRGEQHDMADQQQGEMTQSSNPVGSRPPQSTRSDILTKKLSQLLWMQQFQASPLPLTYVVRMRIRAHLSQPSISRGKHIEKAINDLPIPRMFRNFLSLKDYRKSFDVLL